MMMLTLGYGHTEWGGKCASHARYAMTCDDFEDLWIWSGGHCGICRQEGHETPHGLLHIDHDAARGEWAVRGLLCSRDNTRRVDQSPDYLARPWYLDMLARRAISVRMPPEPAIGTELGDNEGRRFKRTEPGWLCGTPKRGRAGYFLPRPRTWRWLYIRRGPHNLLPIHASRPFMEGGAAPATGGQASTAPLLTTVALPSAHRQTRRVTGRVT